MAETEVKEGQTYEESGKGVKFPRIIKIRKVTELSKRQYVYYVAENETAKAIHPNGGFTPLDSFVTMWSLQGK